MRALAARVDGSRCSRIAAAATALTVLLALATVAPGQRALASERGAIRGRVVNRTTGRPEPRVRVLLWTGRRDGGSPRSRSTLTDRRGRFGFDGLRTGEGRVYAIDARHDGGLFAGRALTLPAGTSRPPVVATTVGVWDTTSDPGAVVIERDAVFVIPERGGAAAIHSVSVVNPTERAYVGRAARGAGPGPTIAFSLPAGAETEGLRIVSSDLDVPDLVARPDLGGFAVTVAIPPGETSFTFTYPLASSAGGIDLSRRALYPVSDLDVFAASPLEVSSDDLEHRGKVTIEGRTYERWAARGALDAGDAVQALARAPARLRPLWVTAAALLLIAAGGAAVLGLRRRKPVPSAERTGNRRRDLVDAIAELDLRRRSGDIAEEDWARRRAQLKSRLSDQSDRETERAP
jgi:hypothetical protein